MRRLAYCGFIWNLRHLKETHMPLDKFIINVYCEIKDLSPASGAANTCVLMPATPAPKYCASCRRMATWLMSKGAGKKRMNSNASPPKRPGAGLLKWCIAGSTAFANYWCAMENLNAAFSRSIISPLPSSPLEKYR